VEAEMDWPSRNSESGGGSQGEPIWWVRFERAFWDYVSEPATSGPGVTETLHTLARRDGRLPLIAVVGTDNRRRVVDVAVFDADDYDG
jgi:hypothetical protein